MKLLLTSGGVTNPSIARSLRGLLGKDVEDSRALCIPTAQWGHPACGPDSARGFVAAGAGWEHSSGLGWGSVGMLELTALPTVGRDRWVPWVQDADVLLVDGGDATYLHHWLRESGLAEVLPSLTSTVWVGISAGSMVLTPRIGPEFVAWSGAADDRTLGLVDFALFPHLDAFPENSEAHAERWAAGIGVPAYAIDEQTAVEVDGGVGAGGLRGALATVRAPPSPPEPRRVRVVEGRRRAGGWAGDPVQDVGGQGEDVVPAHGRVGGPADDQVLGEGEPGAHQLPVPRVVGQPDHGQGAVDQALAGLGVDP